MNIFLDKYNLLKNLNPNIFTTVREITSKNLATKKKIPSPDGLIEDLNQTFKAENSNLIPTLPENK